LGHSGALLGRKFAKRNLKILQILSASARKYLWLRLGLNLRDLGLTSEALGVNFGPPGCTFSLIFTAPDTTWDARRCFCTLLPAVCSFADLLPATCCMLHTVGRTPSAEDFLPRARVLAETAKTFCRTPSAEYFLPHAHLQLARVLAKTAKSWQKPCSHSGQPRRTHFFLRCGGLALAS